MYYLQKGSDSVNHDKAKKKLDKKTILKYVFSFLFIGMICYSVFSLIGNYADISRLNAQAAQNTKTYNQQIEDNEKIKAILDSENKDDYIEQKAREKGYVKEGETVFYDISSSK